MRAIFGFSLLIWLQLISAEECKQYRKVRKSEQHIYGIIICSVILYSLCCYDRATNKYYGAQIQSAQRDATIEKRPNSCNLMLFFYKSNVKWKYVLSIVLITYHWTEVTALTINPLWLGTTLIPLEVAKALNQHVSGNMTSHSLPCCESQHKPCGMQR